MDNIKMNVKGNKLIIEVDLSAKGLPSASGKTTVLASTRGNAAIPGKPNLKVGLNIFKKT